MTCYVGLDLGGTNIKGALVGADGTLLARRSVPTRSGGATPVIKQFADLVADLGGAAGNQRVGGVGVAIAGPVDADRGHVHAATNIPGWEDIPLGRQLGEATGLPVAVDNDANAAAFGEYWAGTGSDGAIQHLIMLTLGTGIGGGVISDGRLVRGAFDAGTELGHVIVEPAGRRCGCGQRGCVEAYASASATVRAAEARIGEGERSSLGAVREAGEELTSRAIFDAAESGDAVAAEVVGETIDRLATACVSLCRVFDPQQIVFGGGVAAEGEDLLGPLRERFRAHSWSLLPDRVELVTTALGNDAGTIGAAGLGARQASGA